MPVPTSISILMRGGAVTIVLGAVLAMPEGNLSTLPPEFVFVINVAKTTAWCGMAYGLIKLCRILNDYYQAFIQHIYEHRLVTTDLWERRPDKYADFQAMLATPVPVRVRAKGASAGKQ